MAYAIGAVRRLQHFSRSILLALAAGILAGQLAACGTSEAPAEQQALPIPDAGSASACPQQLDVARFASADALWAHHIYLDGLKARPTGSPSHMQFVDWLDARLGEIPGLERRESVYTIDHWLESGASLEAGAGGVMDALDVAGSVPYSLPTPEAGVAAPLIHVPLGQAISASDVRGKIILREAATGSIPQVIFLALAWWSYDPDLDLTLGLLNNYERDFLAYDARMIDLREAGAGGATGLILTHDFPVAQVRGHYAPYEGERWPVPALYVGADEAARLKEIAAAGGEARIRVAAEQGPVSTRSLYARLPGQSAERIVIESHTDGTNVHEDNGPLVMLEMARYFASLPQACRPKTLEFAFNTAHFFQQIFPPLRHGGAGQFARELDFDYEDGTVAMVLVLEHMGTLGYDAVPRRDGGPGRELVLSGRPEPHSVFVSASPVLIASLLATTVTHDLRGTIALRGADLPGVHIPLHHSFGGEGTPYNEHLLPTIATITAPWALYNPAFGLEVLDPQYVHREALMFTDLVRTLAPVPRALLAGGVLAERAARELLCALPPGDLVECENTPAAGQDQP
jgi:hypothetical protein